MQRWRWGGLICEADQNMLYFMNSPRKIWVKTGAPVGEADS